MNETPDTDTVIYDYWPTDEVTETRCGYITCCPKCILEDSKNKDGLTFESDGVASCRHHGIMTMDEMTPLFAACKKKLGMDAG